VDSEVSRYFQSLDDLHWYLLGLPNGDIMWASICIIPKNDHEDYVQVMSRKRYAVIPYES
jgi:hypothetical protein